MDTKDLIKKLSKPQKPAQLVKPERVEVKVVALEEDESANDCINREVIEMTKEEKNTLEYQIDKTDKKVSRLFEKYQAQEDAMGVLLEDYLSVMDHCEELEERIAELEKPLYKKLFRRKAKHVSNS